MATSRITSLMPIGVSLFLISLFSSVALANVEVGQQAPNFTLNDSQEESISLSSFNQDIVVLEWTNHECPYVGKHYGSHNMQTLQKQYGAKQVIWLSIISSAPGKQGYVEPAEARRLTVSRDASPYAVLFDPEGKVGKMYGATNTPHMFVIDKGRIAYMGGIDSIRSADPDDIPQARNHVAAALDELLAGKPVSVPVSRPYGCGVKYKGGWW